MAETNGYDPEALRRFLNEIDREDDELATLKGEYMNACRGPRGRIKEVMSAAREAEFNMPAFRVLLKKHRADRAQEARVAALEADDANAFELMRDALGEFGDTPLGQAALDRVRPSGDEALSGLQP